MDFVRKPRSHKSPQTKKATTPSVKKHSSSPKKLKLKKYHPNLRRLSSLVVKFVKKNINLLIALAILTVVIVILLPHKQASPPIGPSSSKQQDQPNIKGNLTKGVPDFDTLLPAGKSIDDLGGWTKVSPVDRDSVYAFVDYIGQTKVIVSQQEIPQSLKESEDLNIGQLAAGYSANDHLTANGAEIYIGTSAKGPQSLIVKKHNLLILIKSTAKIADNVWIEYINSLN